MSDIYSEVLISIPSDFTPVPSTPDTEWTDAWVLQHNTGLKNDVAKLTEELKLERVRVLARQTGFSLSRG